MRKGGAVPWPRTASFPSPGVEEPGSNQRLPSGAQALGEALRAPLGLVFGCLQRKAGSPHGRGLIRSQPVGFSPRAVLHLRPPHPLSFLFRSSGEFQGLWGLAGRCGPH